MSSGRDFTHTNPFGLGGWSDNSGFWRLSPTGSSSASSQSSGTAGSTWHPQPPTFGALPGSSSGSVVTDFVAFRFDARRGRQDQYIVGPGESLMYRIVAQGANQTAIADSSQRVVMSIEWHQIPVFERAGRRFTAPEWLRSVAGRQ